MGETTRCSSCAEVSECTAPVTLRPEEPSAGPRDVLRLNIYHKWERTTGILNIEQYSSANEATRLSVLALRFFPRL